MVKKSCWRHNFILPPIKYIQVELRNFIIMIMIIIIIIDWTANGFYPAAVLLQEYTSHKITHHTQTKDSTQSYRNNRGHITHNEYNTKK
jgi:hypothetical protein